MSVYPSIRFDRTTQNFKNGTGTYLLIISDSTNFHLLLLHYFFNTTKLFPFYRKNDFYIFVSSIWTVIAILFHLNETQLSIAASNFLSDLNLYLHHIHTDISSIDNTIRP